MTTGATPEQTPIEEGIGIGFARAQDQLERMSEFVFTDDFTTPLTESIQEVISENPDMSDRSVVLFSELTTIANVSRATYGEELLTTVATRDFAEHFKRFMNSWTHRESR